MSNIYVESENGHAIAYTEGRTQKVILGQKKTLGIPLSPDVFGVDDALARTQNVAINVHNALERFTENCPITVPLTIAVLGMLTSEMLPKELQHGDHNIHTTVLTADLNRKGKIEYAKRGIEELTEDVAEHPGKYRQYGGDARYLRGKLAELNEMLGHPTAHS